MGKLFFFFFLRIKLSVWFWLLSDIYDFALYCLFGRAVSTYISVSEVITVLIKYYVRKCPSCTRHQYISNRNIEAVKFASYPCLWASWESSSKKTFIGLVLENETEKQQYTFFFFFTEHYVCRCPRSTCYQVISSHNNKNANTASLCCPWLWDSYQTNIHCLMLQEWCKFENIYIFLWQKS